jgi:hypothetical protein
MNPGEKPSVFPAEPRRERGYVFVVICALVSVGLMRSGFMSFFFLVPLGYAAVVCSYQSARRALAAAIGLNAILSLFFYLFLKSSPEGQLLLALYYTLMALVFFWIMAPPERGFSILRVRTAFRFIGASLAGGLLFLLTAYLLGGFGSLFRVQAELLSALFISSAGADAARLSFLERYVTPERIMEMMKLAALRGGAVVSALLLFFISRQAALFLAWISRRVRPGRVSGGLRGFFAPPRTIWVLSLSLGIILVSRFLGIGPLETAAWNILTLCVMLFLAQGGGIVLFTLSRRAMPPVMRFLLNLLILVLIFSPGINAFALGVLALLGIAENWVPFRAPKSDESSSTPGI